MTLQLDPRFPRVWRSPTELQFGVERRMLVLHDVTNAEERLIAALEAGVTRGGLAALARNAGASVDEVDVLLLRLRPVLRERSGAKRVAPRAIAVDGHGPTAARIAHLLGASGFHVTSDIADVDRVSAAVVVANFAVRPDRYARWLRRDVPHLAVVFGDRSATIGPLVEPGAGPCLGCCDRVRTEADPAWLALATQLSPRESHVQTPLVSTAVAALAARMLVTRMSTGSRRFQSAGVRYDAASGATTVVEFRQHEECGCRAPRGSATALADRAAGRRPPN